VFSIMIFGGNTLTTCKPMSKDDFSDYLAGAA